MHAAGGHLVTFAARQDVGKGALAGAVGPHDGMDFAGVHFQAQTLEDLAALDLRVQILDLEHGCLFC